MQTWVVEAAAIALYNCINIHVDMGNLILVYSKASYRLKPGFK